MNEYMLIICIIIILLYYYTKGDLFSPLIQHYQHVKLKNENKKLKKRIKYLEEYKNDISKTFKILDNELELINRHIKNTGEDTTFNTDRFSTSITPSVLNSLLQFSHNPLSNILENTQQDGTITQNTQQQDGTIAQNTQQQDGTITQNTQQQDGTIPQQDGTIPQQAQQHSQPEVTNDVNPNVSLSVNYLPLNSTYRRYLIRPMVSNTVSNILH